MKKKVINFEDYIHELKKTLSENSYSLITDFLAMHADKQPDKLCTLSDSVSFTFKEVNDLSRVLAEFLRKKDNQHGVIVIFGARTPFLIISVLAAIKAGNPFSIIDPKYPVEHIKTRLKYLNSSICIDCGVIDIRKIAYKFKTIINCKNFDYLNNLTVSVDDSQITSTNTKMYVNFTSGTSGVLKAVWGCYNPIGHFIDWQIKQFDITGEDKVSVLSGLSHDPIYRDLFLPLTVGASSYYPEESCFTIPGKLFKWIFEKKITVIHATPSICDLLFTLPDSLNEIQLYNLRYLFLGGEQLSQNIVNKIWKHAPDTMIINCYGATETPQVMSFYNIEKSNQLVSTNYYPIGKGIADVQLLILNENKKVCFPKEHGEIFIRTPYRALKVERIDKKSTNDYINNPFTLNDWDLLYKTGDIGFYDDNYNLFITGRKDRQVKVHGFRFNLTEIEKELLKLEYIESVYVISKQNMITGQNIIVAFIIHREAHAVKENQIKGDLKAKVPEYMVPDFFFFLNDFPLTANGKVDVEMLEQRYFGEMFRNEDKKNKNKNKNKKGPLFEVLNNADIYFHEGEISNKIDSLKGIEILCAIQNKFNIKIDITKLFTMQTEDDFSEFEKCLLDQNRVNKSVNSKDAKFQIIDKKIKLFPRNESVYRAIINRVLQLVARIAPDVIRIKCHKIRGVRIGKNVSIGYDSVIETSYPFLVQIDDNVNIGMRTTIIGHFRGMNAMDHPTVLIEKNAFVGPCVIILPNIKIGYGAVIAAGSVVNSSIPELSFALGNPAKVIARCGIPLTGKVTYNEFMSRLEPL